jgi:hypothetical protein
MNHPYPGLKASRPDRTDPPTAARAVARAVQPLWWKVLLAFALAACFVIVASFIAPTGTQAGISLGGEDAAAATPELDPDHMGTLTARDAESGGTYIIELYAGPDEPLYTVLDDRGNTLAERLTAYEVDAQFPGIGLDQLQATGLGQVEIDVDGSPF